MLTKFYLPCLDETEQEKQESLWALARKYPGHLITLVKDNENKLKYDVRLLEEK